MRGNDEAEYSKNLFSITKDKISKLLTHAVSLVSCNKITAKVSHERVSTD